MRPYFYAFLLAILGLACQTQDKASQATTSSTQSSQPSLTFTAVPFAKQNSYRGLHWTNDSTVWLSGSNGSILVSNNAGQSWDSLNTPTNQDYRSIWVLDNGTIITAPAGQPAAIFTTSSNGEIWQEVYNNDNEAAFFDAIHFVDENTGFAFSDPVEGEFLLLKTNDGGATWHQEKTIPDAWPGEAGFAASNASIASSDGNLFIGTGGSQSRIFKHNITSKGWQVNTISTKFNSEAGGIYAMATQNNRYGIVAVGGAYDQPNDSTGTAFYSHDSGKSWQAAKTLPKGYLSGVANIPGTTIFVGVGTRGTQVSFDAGVHWQEINNYSLNTIRFNPSGTIGLAVGSKGRLYKVEIN